MRTNKNISDRVFRQRNDWRVDTRTMFRKRLQFDHYPHGIKAVMGTFNNGTHQTKSSNAGELSDWIRLTQAPIIISILASAVTFVATIALYRQLHQEDAGVLTLALAIIQLLMLASLGQPTLIQRMYSQAAVGAFNWLPDLVVSILVSIPLIFLICIPAFHIYNFTVLHILLIITAALMQIGILTESQMLNSSRHYAWASILLRLPNSMLIIPAAVLLMVGASSELDTVLGLYSVLSAIVAGFGLYLVHKFLARGPRRILWKERLDGVIFLFTQSSYSLPEQGIVAIGGGLLPASQLAVFGAMAVLLKPFELLTGVLRNVLTTELIRRREQKRTLPMLTIMGIAALALGLTIFFGPAFMALIYSRRYTEGAAMIPWLALAGSFRLVEILPRSYVIGNARQHALRRFVFWQVLLAVCVVFAGWWVIREQGVVAIVWLMALIQFGRTVISSRYYRKTETEFDGNQATDINSS